MSSNGRLLNDGTFKFSGAEIVKDAYMNVDPLILDCLGWLIAREIGRSPGQEGTEAGVVLVSGIRQRRHERKKVI